MRADRGVLPQPGLIGSAIRAGRDGDGPAILVLIARCWADYPGCVMDVDGELPEVRGLARHYGGLGGAFWVAEGGAGMVAAVPSGAGVWEICRVYVDPGLHGTGLGHALMDVAEGHAGALGATELELWSDTRFGRAHAFYGKRGYVRGGERVLGDLSGSAEYRFSRGVAGVGGRARLAGGSPGQARG